MIVGRVGAYSEAGAGFQQGTLEGAAGAEMWSARGVCSSRGQSQLWAKGAAMGRQVGFRQTIGSFEQRGQAKASIPTLPSGSLGQVHSVFGSVSLTVPENFHPLLARRHTSLVVDFHIPFSSLASVTYQFYPL